MEEAESAKEAPEAGDEKDAGASATNDDSTKAADDYAEKKEDSAKDKEQKAEAAAEAAVVEANGATPSSKQAARRKSTGTPAAKKLNKKASKARILHLDCTPGDHFFARLKGFPPWPVIIADESMLPQTMLSTRPVTAARPDGSYREDFADGGKRAADRTYPVMYLYTNEL